MGSSMLLHDFSKQAAHFDFKSRLLELSSSVGRLPLKTLHSPKWP